MKNAEKTAQAKALDRNIHISNAKVNNLKGVTVDLARNSFTVVTGVSGSGKSSLAFDTLYAEGQRRYVESLSAYARQFMGKMHKPECDLIRGLPPAIAIEQKVNTRNPRSTVGTSTEIYDYLRLLFGRVGRTFSPVTGREVRRHNVDDIVAAVTAYPEGTRMVVAAPLIIPEGRDLVSQIPVLISAGYSRVIDADGTPTDMDELLANPPASSEGLMLLIDRLAVEKEGEEVSRLADSVETAIFEGKGEAIVMMYEHRGEKPTQLTFSTRFEADGMTFTEPSEQMFNFNNPFGACPECEGFGKSIGIDESLVVPDRNRSVYNGAVAAWRGPKMDEWRVRFLSLATRMNFPVHKPYAELSDEERDILWHGSSAYGWEGIDGFFQMVEENQYKIQYRIMKAKFRGKRTCTLCHGTRLRRDALYVRVGGMTISEMVAMPVSRLYDFFETLKLEGNDGKIAERLLAEIRSRLRFLIDVGLGYLTLDRASNTLSGGESQRINLATSLGSSLVGSLYILDEPSIGLHSRDTGRLIGVLRRLQQIGNTVVVVEHDEEIMEAADSIIDVGPAAGSLGGEIVYSGPIIPAPADTRSLTLRYLDGSMSIPLPKSRRKWRNYVEIVGATEHNLKDITVKFPLDVLTVVTGVSGSGKSTLVRDILYKSLALRNGDNAGVPGAHKELNVSRRTPLPVIFVDQNSIGKSTRSNPATYLKAFDEIRRLFAEQPAAKQMGFPSGYFSFNVEGGRCERCKGEGTITIEMQFMADITIECEECHGERYKRDVLAIRYRGKNISEVLDMTVDDAIAFFNEADEKDTTAHRIVRRLRPLADVGLGYIKLGQSSSTLSGGENQRVKLAYYLVGESLTGLSMFIFDEPTTGLHFHDIRRLMECLNRLVDMGHTVVVIEHNMDVIKMADHVIDIGPEGGDAGGEIVATGTPEEIAACPASITGRYLAPKLSK
ncbi:MAG: excinuclease ABC subunit UvrA [Pseudoflavonifractor sp.]|nr:excinuclease ABC subunit UvrA [Alloprevotella sp.]MCM1116485.1 excinuclease ABC subunit UvrA [Pseudoflavonifractor sp.]